MDQQTSATPRLAYSTALPKLQFAWDNTSLSALKKCPRLYQLEIVEGWQQRGTAIALTFGIHYHKALELAEKAKIEEGMSHDDAVRIAARYCLEQSFEGDSNRNRETLVRSVVWYLDHFKDAPIRPLVLDDGRPALELSFRVELDYEFSTGDAALYCGHLDRAGYFGDTLYIADHKTTTKTINSWYFDGYSPDNQMTGYTFGAKATLRQPVQGVIIDAAQIMVEGTRFARGIVHRTPAQLDEWYRDTLFYLRLANTYAQADYWPMNTSACYNCRMRPVCSRDPSVREFVLRDGYEKRDRPWDPLEVR